MPRDIRSALIKAIIIPCTFTSEKKKEGAIKKAIYLQSLGKAEEDATAKEKAAANEQADAYMKDNEKDISNDPEGKTGYCDHRHSDAFYGWAYLKQNGEADLAFNGDHCADRL